MTTLAFTSSASGLLLAHLDAIADAPGGVARLRQLILQLAVQGRLVEQDPDDEPASALVQEINKAKKRLESCGKKIDNSLLPTVEEKDHPYPIPVSWRWVRLGEIVYYNAGQKIEPAAIPEEAWLLELEDIEKDSSRILQRLCVKDRLPKSNKSEFEKGDVLYGKLRPYLNKVIVADQNGYCTTEIVPLRGYFGLDSYYLKSVLKSPYFFQYVNSITYGVKMPRLGTDDAKQALVPLPPLAEQRRIVERVDALMGLCDALEARQAREGEGRRRLLAALVDGLLGARDAGEAAAAWARLSDSFDVALDAPKDVASLREAVLQLAFQGRLTERLSTDEFTSALLKQMRPETSSSPQKQEKESITSDAENTSVFVIPSTWSWTNLDSLCEQIGDIDHKMPKAVPSGVPFLSAKDLKDDGSLDFSDPKFISEEDFKRLSRKILPRRGDIIYSRIGARLGKARLVEVDTTFLISYSCCLIRPKSEYIDKKYLQLFLDSKLALNQAHLGAQSIGVPDLGLGEIKNYKIPYAPLAEQRRVVARVEQLMALCDDLEARLREERAAAEQFSAGLCRAAAGAPLGGDVAPAREPAEGDADGQPEAPEAAVSPPPAVEPARAGQAGGEGAADEAHQAAAALLTERGALTNGDLQAALGIDAAAARALLRRLVAEGLARQEGERRGGRYVRV